MRKRSLAEAFQASLAEDDAKAPRRASPPDEDETGADYMSDALLEQLEARAFCLCDTVNHVGRETALSRL